MNFKILKTRQISRIYEKTCKWLRYLNFKNLQKNLQMASVCEFQKCMIAIGSVTCHIFLSFEFLVRKEKKNAISHEKREKKSNSSQETRKI